MITHIKRLG